MKEPVKSHLIKRLLNTILLRRYTEYVIIEQYCLIRVFNVHKDASIGGYSPWEVQAIRCGSWSSNETKKQKRVDGFGILSFNVYHIKTEKRRLRLFLAIKYLCNYLII